MFALVKKLQQEKVEHESDPASCEDYSDFSIDNGLFVAADGAGTAIFANIWAKHLVEHFLKSPLMSENPFEVEWWIRQAQSTFTAKVPLVQDWNAQQKAQADGSQSTLATMRVSEVAELTVKAEFLVFGDSCIIVGSPTSQTIESFPLEQPEDFDARPVCIPSLLKKFNRDFNICQIRKKTLQLQDIVIIATDAVACWIISGKNRPGGQWAAFKEVAEKKPEQEWKAFVQARRNDNTLVDDDSTALVIELKVEEVEGAKQLGITIPPHALHVREERKRRYVEAYEISNRELMAIYFGDGADLYVNDYDSPGIRPSKEEIQSNREVANALKALIAALRTYINSPNAVQKIEESWRKYELILLNEPCADAVRKTINNKGITLDSKDLTTSKQSKRKDEKEALPSQTFLERFRNAIVTEDDIQIIQAFDSSLNENLEVKEDEWVRLRMAIYAFYKGCKIEEKITQPTISLAFWHAYYNRQDDRMLEKYEELKSYNPNLSLPSDVQKYVSLAQNRQRELERFYAAVATGNARNIVNAFKDLKEDVDISNTSEIYKKLQWADEWLEAYNSDDDNRIIRIYDNIEKSQQAKFITFTDIEEQRIQIARKRQNALEEWRQAISNARPQEIFAKYSKNKDVFEKVLSGEQKQIAQLTKWLAEAYDQKDDQAIVCAHDRLSQSPYATTFAFTSEETGFLEQARGRLEKVVAIVNKKYVTSEEYRKIAVMRDGYISHRLKTLKDQLDSSNYDLKQKEDMTIEQNWLQKAKDIHHPYLISQIIEDIIDDIIINKDLRDNKVDLLPQFEQRSKARFDRFKSSKGFERLYKPPYSLRDADIEIVIELFLRRLYLIQRLGIEQADKWLHDQKAMMQITRYPDHAPIIESSRNWWGGRF
jgi:hypothetical protein